MVAVWLYSLCLVARASDEAVGTRCHRGEKALTLCIDLRNDHKLTSSLIVFVAQADGRERHVLLPFKSLNTSTNEVLLSSTGSLSNGTLLSFFPNTPGQFQVDFTPQVDTDPKSNDDQQSDAPISFITDGLERRFTFRSSTGRPDIPALAKANFKDEIDEIAILRPRGYEGIEVRPNTNKISSPDALAWTTDASFFAPRGDDGQPVTVRLHYRVPATQGQALLGVYASKFLIAVVAPLLGVIFIPGADNARPKLRLILIGVLFVIQGALAYGAIHGASFAAGSSVTNVYLDWCLAVFSAAGALFPAWIKSSKAPKNALPVTV
jgi:hypothetical protein